MFVFGGRVYILSMKKNIKKLTSQELAILKKHFKPIKFNHSFNLVYEEQVPNTGIVLLDGGLDILRKKKVEESIAPGNLLGLHQLLHNEPVKRGCQIRKDSEVIMIQKSDVLEALEDEDSELYPILACLKGA
jgi:signal-transduction protein with cAMP-binding, CBS, and nucleotidyltransferase domain